MENYNWQGPWALKQMGGSICRNTEGPGDNLLLVWNALGYNNPVMGLSHCAATVTALYYSTELQASFSGPRWAIVSTNEGHALQS